MKKFLRSLTAITIGVSLFAGCASGGASSTSNNSKPATEETKQNSELSEQLKEEDIKGEITISAYDQGPSINLLNSAAADFMKTYPGTKVNIEAAAKMPEIKKQESGDKSLAMVTMGNDEGERDNYINNVNTALMSGKGADIYAMDVLPYTKYAEGGQLENLQTYMDADSSFNQASIRQNILDAMKFKGGLYFMPLDYSFNFFAYDSSFVEADKKDSLFTADGIDFKQAIELLKPYFEKANENTTEKDHIFLTGLEDFGGRNSFFNALFNEDYGKYINLENKKANLSSGDFATLLETVSKYAQDGYIKKNVASSGEVPSLESFEAMQNEKFILKYKESFNMINQYNKNENVRMISPGMGDDSNDVTLGIEKSIDGKIATEFNQAYAINANSQNKATAWAFIKFLLGGKYQTSPSLMGLPINNKARSEKAILSISGELYKGNFVSIGADGKPKTEEVTEINVEDIKLDDKGQATYDRYMKDMESMSDQINTFYFRNSAVDSAINSEVENYSNGSKSAADVANQLQNKVNLMLTE